MVGGMVQYSTTSIHIQQMSFIFNKSYIHIQQLQQSTFNKLNSHSTNRNSHSRKYIHIQQTIFTFNNILFTFNKNYIVNEFHIAFKP